MLSAIASLFSKSAPVATSVDAAHREMPEKWADSYDFNAWSSNKVHALMDAGLGTTTVSGLNDAERTLVFSAVCCVVVCGVMYLARWLMSPVLTDVAPSKRMYVVANIVKSLILALQSLSPSWWWGAWSAHACTLNLFGFDYTCSWPHAAYAKQICGLYVASDAVALLIVPKLPTTTVVHHVCSVLILIWFAYTDLAASPIIQKMSLYGCWASVAWPVNLFLALRVVVPHATWMGLWAQFSFVVYFLTCFFNWGQHLLWLTDNAFRGVLRWQEVAYVLSLSIVINDDLILMGWCASRTHRPLPARLSKSSSGQRRQRCADVFVCLT
jgi:hypothetical protein